MTDQQQAIHAANVRRYGPLPEPHHFRDGPKGEDGRPLDPERKLIAVYPDGTFPTQPSAPLK